MKLFLSILILIVSLQSWTKADDIKEFEIEGISIGDSLLDHMSIKNYEIFKKDQYEYVHTFATIQIKIDNLNLYDQVRGYYKIKDKNKIIHAVEGTTIISNISECIKLMSEVTDEIDKDYSHLKSEKNVFNHWADKSNKSKVHQIDYEFNSGEAIAVQCVDWSKKMEYENGWIDNFRVTLFDKDTLNFLRSLN
tara:strand:+ start:715 stop:1293 length:579 start_codon:yes stop_codon:yes gene_type:complete